MMQQNRFRSVLMNILTWRGIQLFNWSAHKQTWVNANHTDDRRTMMMQAGCCMSMGVGSSAAAISTTLSWPTNNHDAPDGTERAHTTNPSVTSQTVLSLSQSALSILQWRLCTEAEDTFKTRRDWDTMETIEKTASEHKPTRRANGMVQCSDDQATPKPHQACLHHHHHTEYSGWINRHPPTQRRRRKQFTQTTYFNDK